MARRALNGQLWLINIQVNPQALVHRLTGMFLGNCVNAHGEKELGTKRPDFMTPPMKKRREGAHVATFATASVAVLDLDHGVP